MSERPPVTFIVARTMRRATDEARELGLAPRSRDVVLVVEERALRGRAIRPQDRIVFATDGPYRRGVIESLAICRIAGGSA